MKKKRLLIMILGLSLGWGSTLCAQTMSDGQVLEFVKESVQQGKEQKQIAAELARRGVTKEQALRVKEQYERQNGTAATSMTGTDQNEARLREETKDETSALLDEQPTTQELAQEEQVFGRNIFNTRNLTFEPNNNMPTPPNYRLGPGDEVVIDIWGASQNTIRQTISPDGTINLQELGPAYLSGMTVEEAGRFLKEELGKIYSNENNRIRVTLGNTRTIQINIMGEVVQPGTYALSAFSTVFHALYRAGGVNRIGSLRDVQLVRNGKKIASVDVYDFIMQGRVKDDIGLQEGDVIIVPAYEALVKMSGKVKRAMKFEMRKGETLSTLIDYAGGFEADAYTKNMRIVRQNGEEYEVKTVERPEYPVTELRDGDVVTVGAILNRFTNKVEIKGAVYRPDIYELDGKVNTVRALIDQASGLMEDAFTARAVLQRQREEGGLICVVSHSAKENISRDYQTHFGLQPDRIYGWELGPEKRKPAPYPLDDIMAGLFSVRYHWISQLLIDICRKHRSFERAAHHSRGEEKSLVKGLHYSKGCAHLLPESGGSKSVRAVLDQLFFSHDVTADRRKPAARILDQRANDHVCSHIAGLDPFHKLSVAVIYHADHLRASLLDKCDQFPDLFYGIAGTGLISLGALDGHKFCPLI